MRISKMVLNLTVLAFVAGFAVNASAASSSANAVCNSRVGIDRDRDSNPVKISKSVSKRQSSGPEKRNSKLNKGKH